MRLFPEENSKARKSGDNGNGHDGCYWSNRWTKVIPRVH